MSLRVWAMGFAAVLLAASPLPAETAPWPASPPVTLSAPAPAVEHPFFLDDVYIYPQLGPREDSQVNNGGAHFDFDLRYLSNYIYRGVDQTTLGHDPENSLQFEGKASFDLGNWPHPFIGLFVNVFNEDPVSRFEEVRPFAGLEWTLKPFTFAGGFNAYIYPNRKPQDTQDVWAKLTINDALIVRSRHPFLSPYIYAAYDVALYHGFYFESGIKHDFEFDDFGVILTPFADVAYVLQQPYFTPPGGHTDSGFQHYDIGMTGSLSLNNLFKTSRRNGEWSVVGYLYYTDGITNHLRADTLIWGGVGLRFSY